jgi:CheY-like chemotaxis protein/anti-anti-sigma regulatory factor
MGEDGKRRLLIIDDEAEIRTTLAEYFQSVGYAVDTAQDSTTALERLGDGLQVILSDIRMPDESGIQFLQQARKRNPDVGVFLITGYPTLETVIDAKQYGAAAYFRKPLNLMEVDSRIRAFLGEDARSLVDGRILIVGHALMDRLADRLVRFQTLTCAEEETAFLDEVGRQRPKAVLADAGSPETPGLLRSYQRLGRETNAFLLVSDEDALDAASEMLFSQGASGCIPMDAPREVLERRIKETVEFREMQRLDQQGRFEELTNKCMFAKAYRNGYYCQKQGNCLYGPFQGGWIAIEGKEYQKCAKRPLLVTSLEQVGFTTWAGRIEAVRAPELRKQLLAIVREGKREIVVDAQGLESANYSLFEILSDTHADLVKSQPDGVMHIINLSPQLLEEFRKAMINKGIRFYGVRMVDERSTFERWGTRFE